MFSIASTQIAHNQQHSGAFFTTDTQAIVALCTPRGSGAIALIRISGSNAIAVADSIARLSSGALLAACASHTIHHGLVTDALGKRIDEVLFLLMKAPKTFTGQDCVEITCHNNQFVIEAIINRAIACGARVAGAGEFTKRAFLNGKLDLLQAEALNDFIHASTEEALQRSMAQLKGSFSQRCATVEEGLVQLLGYVEASFEFLDEEQRDFSFESAVQTRTADILETIQAIRAQFAHQKQIKDGVCIALVGATNVGKSTLFNALVGTERAIVAPIAGTTRDSIETNLYDNGTFWLLIDTAGIRSTDDVIEKKGIDRSFAEADRADIILLTIDATVAMDEQTQLAYKSLIEKHDQKIIGVVNKIDCAHDTQVITTLLPQEKLVFVSAHLKLGIAELKATINQRVQSFYTTSSAPFLINQRQFRLLTEIETGLQVIANSYKSGIHYELVAYHVKDLLEKVSALTGKNVTERLLDTVFSEFCVGK